MTGSAVVLQSGGAFGPLVLLLIEAAFSLALALTLLLWTHRAIVRRVSQAAVPG